MGVCSALGACLRKTTTGAIICQSNPRPSQKAVCYILSPSYHHWKLSGQRAFVIDFPHFSYLFSIILALLLVIVSTKLFLQSPCFSFVVISTEVEELTFSTPLKKNKICTVRNVITKQTNISWIKNECFLLLGTFPLLLVGDWRCWWKDAAGQGWCETNGVIDSTE